MAIIKITMKKRFVLLLASLPLIVFGQETKEIHLKKTGETFTVLKSDKQIRHGSYKQITENGDILLEGNYSNGTKDGLWTDYYYGPKVTVKSKGNYKNDIQIGVWEFYSRK